MSSATRNMHDIGLFCPRCSHVLGNGDMCGTCRTNAGFAGKAISSVEFRVLLEHNAIARPGCAKHNRPCTSFTAHSQVKGRCWNTVSLCDGVC